MAAAQHPSDKTAGDRARRRISRRLLPFLFVLYMIAYVDRSNIAFAALQMKAELGFSAETIGFGAGVFFCGYFLLEIPGAILVEVWSARKWIARIMISWGIIASLTGLVNTAHQFYVMRFLLGLAEAGFFPGIIVYLSHWFRSGDRGKAVAAFMTAIPVSQLLCGPLAAVLMRVHWWGYSGWRWMLFIEGVPAIVFGIVALFYLTDQPAQARWLSAAEREWIAAELARERHGKLQHGSLRIMQALRHRDVLLLTMTLFFFQAVNYGLITWLPTMLQHASGRSITRTSLLAAVPYLCAVPAVVLAGWYSDRKGERRRHAMAYCGLTGAALLFSLAVGGHWAIALGSWSVAAVGLYSFNPTFYSLPSSFLRDTAAAASIGFINCFGHLGGFLGPAMIGHLATSTGSYRTGLYFLAACAFTAAVLLMFLRSTKAGAVPGCGTR